MRLIGIGLSLFIFAVTAAPVYKPLSKPLPPPRREWPVQPGKTGGETGETKEGFQSAPQEVRVVEIRDPERDLPVQTRTVTAVIENASEDSFSSVVVSCTFAGAERVGSVPTANPYTTSADLPNPYGTATGQAPTPTGGGASVSKQAVLPTLGPKERKTVTFSFNKASDFGSFSRFTGYDPAGALRYDTPVNVSGPQLEIVSATRIPKKEEPKKKEPKKEAPKKEEEVKKEEPVSKEPAPKEPAKEEPKKY